MSRNFLAVALLLVAASAGRAQTSCSPAVPAKTCKAVADQANLFLSHDFFKGATLSLVVLTPGEFAKRQQTVEKEDADLGLQCGGCPPAYPGAPKYQLFENGFDNAVMFLRPKGSRNPYPAAIVVSTAQFEDSVTDKDGAPLINEDGKLVWDGKFHEHKVFQFLGLVGAYLEGMSAVLFDYEVAKASK